MPASISGESYPMTGTDEERSNFLSAGLSFMASYDDSVFAGFGKPVAEESYSILPTIALDQTTPRHHGSLSYGAGFIFYQPTSALNSIQQAASARFQYRASVRTTFTVSDSFQQSSNPFNQASPLNGEPINGTPETPASIVIAPYAKQYSNSGNVGFSYQYGKNGMIGASGSTSLLDFPDPAQVPDLNNFVSGGGSGFFSRRLTGAQYLGGSYNYSEDITYPIDSTTKTQTISLFYSIHLSHTLSASASGGPQHYDSASSGVTTSSAWTPAVTTSLGWQRKHSSFAGRYSRTVTGGGGLLGTFRSNSGALEATWQFARAWSTHASGSYFTTKNATPIQYSSNPGGHTLVGMITLEHPIGEYLRTELGYARLNESYNGISSVSSAPNSDRVFFSISYQFVRPLGR